MPRAARAPKRRNPYGSFLETHARYSRKDRAAHQDDYKAPIYANQDDINFLADTSANVGDYNAAHQSTESHPRRNLVANIDELEAKYSNPQPRSSHKRPRSQSRGRDLEVRRNKAKKRKKRKKLPVYGPKNKIIPTQAEMKAIIENFDFTRKGGETVKYRKLTQGNKTIAENMKNVLLKILKNDLDSIKEKRRIDDLRERNILSIADSAIHKDRAYTNDYDMHPWSTAYNKKNYSTKLDDLKKEQKAFEDNPDISQSAKRYVREDMKPENKAKMSQFTFFKRALKETQDYGDIPGIKDKTTCVYESKRAGRGVKTYNLYSRILPFVGKGGVIKYRLQSYCASCFRRKNTILKHTPDKTPEELISGGDVMKGGAIQFIH